MHKRKSPCEVGQVALGNKNLRHRAPILWAEARHGICLIVRRFALLCRVDTYRIGFFLNVSTKCVAENKK